MKRIAWVVGVVLGLFFVARAIAWPFSIDVGDPATYATSWGGPTLAGALAVHCGPGIVAAGLGLWAIVRGRRAAQP